MRGVGKEDEVYWGKDIEKSMMPIHRQRVFRKKCVYIRGCFDKCF